jgi:hypothetical protein
MQTVSTRNESYYRTITGRKLRKSQRRTVRLIGQWWRNGASVRHSTAAPRGGAL